MTSPAQPFQPSEQFAQELTTAQASLYAYILTLIADGDAADDILQQTNMVLWRKSAEFELGTDFVAWACRVAFNEVRTARKRYARNQLLFDDDLLNHVAAAAEQSIELDRRRKALRRCLHTLSDEQQMLLKRRYGRDESVTSIASSLGRPVQSLYQTLFRIRTSLMKCIDRRLRAGNAGATRNGAES